MKSVDKTDNTTVHFSHRQNKLINSFQVFLFQCVSQFFSDSFDLCFFFSFEFRLVKSGSYLFHKVAKTFNSRLNVRKSAFACTCAFTFISRKGNNIPFLVAYFVHSKRFGDYFSSVNVNKISVE